MLKEFLDVPVGQVKKRCIYFKFLSKIESSFLSFEQAVECT